MDDGFEYKIWLTVGWVVVFVGVVARKKLYSSPSWIERTELTGTTDEQGNFLPGMKAFFVTWAIYSLVCMWFEVESVYIIIGFIFMMICQNLYASTVPAKKPE